MGNAELSEKGSEHENSRTGPHKASRHLMYQRCVICGGRCTADHIAIDDGGDPVVMCDECFDKCRPFFQEVEYAQRET